MIESPEDRQKFEAVYEANRTLMFSRAKGILHDGYLAEDAVQQAFLRIIPKFSRLDEFSCNQIRNYLVTVVKHVTFDMLHEQGKIIEIPFDEAYQTGEPEGLDEFIAQLNHAELEEAFAQLTDVYKEPLYLYYNLGLPVNEVAEALGLTASAVKLRLMRGRQKLRALLEEARR
jgi:RNA polymerase sigma-70 factor (ECF subfamily)